MSFEVGKSSKNLKHCICVFLAVIIAFSCMSVCASATTVCIHEVNQKHNTECRNTRQSYIIDGNAYDGNVGYLYLSFNEDGKSYSVTFCDNKASGKIVVPATYNGLPVTTIGNWAFCNCTNVTAVIVSDGVKSIGDNAFDGCAKLVSVMMPDSITSMGSFAFYGCKSLASINIPNGMKHISSWCFTGCTKLKSVTIPDSVMSIGEFAFGSCSSLTSIIIPKSVKNIGGSAFFYCTGLESVTIPDGVTEICNDVFANCTRLKTIIIPNSVTDIYDGAFSECIGLKYVFYKGSKSQWSAINMDLTCNKSLEKAIIHYNAKGHSYKTTTTKATLTKNGLIVKKCSVCGCVSKTTVYYPKTIKLSTATCTYNGNVRTPSVIVKDSKGKTLVNGTDYKVTVPSGRKLPGAYKYTITFIGKYSGSKTLTFKILPATVNAAKMTAAATTSSIRINWQKVTGATGYKVYQYNSSQGKYVQIATVTGNTYKKTGLKAGATYKFKVKAYKKLSNGTVIEGTASSAYATATKCAAPTISSLVASSGQKATIKWSAVTGATGYHVYYSANNSDYKKAVSTTSKTASKTFSKSAKGKKMYFKVRAYKKVNGQTIYGNWSAVKSINLK